MFDVFYISDNQQLQDKFPFAKKVESKESITSNTKMYWLVEPNIELNNFEVLQYRPPAHDQVYEHVWKWNNDNYGGIRLIPTKENKGIKEVNKVVCSKKFDILYTKTPGKYFEKNPYATHVWCVDKEYKLNDSIDWAPDNFEPDFIHSFHLRGQLEHKYPADEGGIKLYPKDWKTAKNKFHTFLDATIEYPTMYVDDVEDYAQRDVYDAEYVWLIDKQHKINKATLDWVPNPFEENMVHVFRMPYQLTEKYPMEMGGIRLIPKQWKKAETKIHPACPIEDENYPVFYVDEDEFTSDTYAQYAQLIKTDWFWIVDRDHTFNGKLLYVPAEHEQEYIHIFKVPGHLDFRYPADATDPWDNRCGGVRLVNKNFNVSKQKYHEDIVPVRYDIFITDDPKSFNSIAKKSRTNMFWSIDSEHSASQIPKYIPSKDEQKQLLSFKIDDKLKHKYPDEDSGIYLVPKSINENTSIKHINFNTLTSSKEYPIYFVEDPNDYSSAKGECWLIDKEYQINTDIEWTPSVFEKNMIHSFHVEGQLEHKYPQEMGGVRWVPNNWKDAELKIHSESLFEKAKFDTFSTEEEGLEHSTTEWYWVIDPDVEVLEEFDFGYVPTVWDKGKKHVWQKLNPKTGRQFDYGGVTLCHKEPAEKGRPKYIREASCTQKEYPIFYLEADDYKAPLDTAYRRFAEQSPTKMFWVVDLYTQISEGFDFDYYPTQWDQEFLHVFENEDGEHKNVRLVPKSLFDEWEYTDEQILNNSLGNLKLMNTVASDRPKWPIIRLDSYDVSAFISELESYRDGYETGTPVPFVWTVDPGSNANSVQNSPVDTGFAPKVADINKIHCWQKVNDVTLAVHGYGGLRLWPTGGDYSKLTSESLRLNKIRNVQYMRSIGTITNTFDIVFLSYYDDNALEKFEKLRDQVSLISTMSKQKLNMIWVKDVDGIFEAHKEAANRVSSKMFWVVDCDADVSSEFEFSYVPDAYDEDIVHVWNSRNPITGMEYGYGGVKLLPTEMVKEATSWGLDFTTGLSSRFKAMPEVSCVTKFNTDAYNTWRSAFRECVKLALKDDAESKQRLEGWLDPVPNADFRDEAKRGAEEGKAYAIANKDNLAELNNINNFDWLYDYYSR